MSGEAGKGTGNVREERSACAGHVAALARDIHDVAVHIHGLTKSHCPSYPAVVRAVFGRSPSDDDPPDCCVVRQLRRLRSREDWYRRVEVLAAEMLRRRELDPIPGIAGQCLCRIEVQIARRMAALVDLAIRTDAVSAGQGRVVGLTEDHGSVALLIEDAGGTDRVSGFTEADLLWNRQFSRRVQAMVRLRATPVPTLVAPLDTMREAGARVVKREVSTLMCRRYGATYRYDPEYVHEMRVASRRIREALRIFGDAFPGAAKEIRAELSGVADALGTARDCDVFLAMLHGYAVEAPPDHQPFLRRLAAAEESRRRRRYRALGARLRPAEATRSMDGLAATLENFDAAEPGTRAGGDRVASQAPRAVRRRLKRVLRCSGPLRGRTEEDLHDLRIACKKLRYLGEFLSSAYPSGLAKLTAGAREMQSLLGDVHDADVYAARVRQYRRLRRRSGDEQRDEAAADALLSHLREWRGSRLARAENVWATLSKKRKRRALWRSTVKAYCARYPAVREAEPGTMVVDGKTVDCDVCVTAAGKARPRDLADASSVYGSVHRIGPVELSKICKGNPRLMVLGTGYSDSVGLTPEGAEFLQCQRIACHVAPTREAIRVFNESREPKAAMFCVT